MCRSTAGRARPCARRRGGSACRPAKRWRCFRAVPADLVAGFSRWADRRMLDRLEALPLEALRGSRADRARRSAFGSKSSSRGARRCGGRLTVLALPQHAPLALRLVYETVDAIWYAAGDTATDFSFYTKRLTLAAIYGASVLYWLDDRSEGFADTRAFLDRRLAGAARIGRARRDLETLAESPAQPFSPAAPAALTPAAQRCGNQPGDVAHLAAGLDLGLAVEVELGERIVERVAPFLDVAADQVLHDRVGMVLDRARAAGRTTRAPAARTGW